MWGKKRPRQQSKDRIKAIASMKEVSLVPNLQHRPCEVSSPLLVSQSPSMEGKIEGLVECASDHKLQSSNCRATRSTVAWWVRSPRLGSWVCSGGLGE